MRVVKPLDKPKPTWTNTFDILRDVVIGMRLYMDVYERDALMFIFSRTEMFGKRSETIPLRHFMEGVMSNGASITAPVSMSRTNLITALYHLEHKGIVGVTKHTTKANIYQVTERSEIDVEHVLEYMSTNQPRQFMSINGRHLKRQFEMEKTLEAAKRVQRITPVLQIRRK